MPELGLPPQRSESLSIDDEESETELNAQLASELTPDSEWLFSTADANNRPNLSIVPGREDIGIDDYAGLSSVSCAGETSRLLLWLLYSAANNLLSQSQASKMFPAICDIDRKLFKAVIARPSPLTRSIARTFISAAMECAEVPLVEALLATGLDPNLDAEGIRGKLFVTAIRTCNRHIIQSFLDYGANVNIESYSGQATPLEAAARTGRCDVVQLLLHAGADLDVSGRDHGASVLAQAAVHGDSELVQLLIDAGADVHGPIRHHLRVGCGNVTAIRRAAMRGDVTMAKLLISHGADVNALRHAAIGGSIDMLQLLLNCGADDLNPAFRAAGGQEYSHVLRFLVHSEVAKRGALHQAFGEEALEAAIACRDVELVRWLLEYGIGISNNPSTLTEALRCSTEHGQVHIAQLLVAHGANVNAPAISIMQATPLQDAVYRKQLHLVEFLLRSGADVNAHAYSSNMTALVSAAAQDQLQIVRLLLEHGADVDKQGALAVAAAIENASPDVLRLLLDAWTVTGSFNPESIDCRYDETALESAARRASIEVTQVLLDFKVYKAGDNSLALPKAIKSGNLDLARLLLASGACIGRLEKYEECAEGWTFITALDEAAGGGHLDMLHLLLLRHQTTKDERTQALQVASSRGNLGAVKILLRHGVNVNAAPMEWSNEEPRTALQAASEAGDLGVVRCLLEAGADVESKVRSPKEEGTALQFAAIAGSISVVAALIQAGADVRAPAIGRYGKTALEGAAEHGRLDIVQLLINMGAEVAGSRTLRFARREGHESVVALLLENRFESSVDKSLDASLTLELPTDLGIIGRGEA